MKERNRHFGRWLPVFLWMLAIFFLSTDVPSAANTSRLLVPFLRWLSHGRLSTQAMDDIHLVIRKCAHLSEYAIVGILICRALAPDGRLRNLTGRQTWGVYPKALALAGLYAASDEFHQSFVPSRTASVHDVFIDITGAAMGLAVVWTLNASRRRRIAVTGQAGCGATPSAPG